MLANCGRIKLQTAILVTDLSLIYTNWVSPKHKILKNVLMCHVSTFIGNYSEDFFHVWSF